MADIHIRELTPDPGERVATFGGTRAGKSAFQEMSMYQVQADRPDAMQILVDTKPRFRAQTERGPFNRGRRNAAHRYSSWSKGPVVHNSVVVDLWNDKPFRGLFQTPGEIAILQSGEVNDWRRMLKLLDAFVKANISGRERRIIVDECLDFTREIRGELTHRTTYFIMPLEQAVKETSVLIWVPIKYRDCPDSFARCYLASRSFIFETMLPT